MCHACAEDRFMPDDLGSTTLADAAAFQARHAMAAESGWPTAADLAEMRSVDYVTSTRQQRAALNGGTA